ncbi:MAG: hypothetical protein HYS86_05085 [Candidatus Chisholmbacteria bacterium]|nr:hypothetical protein [Candidatus Chisholmbacteria bacterium]
MTLADINFNQIESPVEAQIPSDVTGLETILSTAAGFLTITGGILFLTMFIIGAYGWITAEGKPEKLDAARGRIVNAIIGMFILVAAFAAAAVIGFLLGIDILNLSAAIETITNR